MLKLCRILLFVVLLPQMASAFGEPGKHQRQKNISKAFAVNPDALTSVENIYGDISVTTWNEDKIQIEVKITVSGDNEKWVNDRIDNIDVEIKALKNIVSAQTIFSGSSSKSKGKNSIEVNYEIRIPAQGGLKLDNKYGEIRLADIDGPADIKLQYGKFLSGKLMKTAVLDLQYVDKAEIGDVKTCRIEAGYSKVKFGGFETMKIVSNYSDFIIGSGKILAFQGNYGKIDVDAVETFTSDGDYVRIHVGESLGAIKVNSNYGNIKIDVLKGSWTSCSISGDYGTSAIGFSADTGFRYAVEGAYSNIKLDPVLDGNMAKDRSKKSSTGTYKDGSRSIKVSGNYSNLSLFKI